ncbi:G-type lectin S-receptor-like serine/threonine-protein kinase [Acorus calamus]|uniref:G-type lectin S-receptor-like serine/threonine-protein kinase n=1 Tax=Acorus calamus TaxID=4465 RepID=A0AAV9F9T8_ACOCL|nr:G-type lectin S-receptor-like serine/threonine-protein kinase [Acorus calamus]
MAGLHSFWCCGRREIGKGSEEEEEGLFVSLKSLEAATDGFSDSNRLGQGGFGPVFKE